MMVGRCVAGGLNANPPMSPTEAAIRALRIYVEAPRLPTDGVGGPAGISPGGTRSVLRVGEDGAQRTGCRGKVRPALGAVPPLGQFCDGLGGDAPFNSQQARVVVVWVSRRRVAV